MIFKYLNNFFKIPNDKLVSFCTHISENMPVTRLISYIISLQAISQIREETNDGKITLMNHNSESISFKCHTLIAKIYVDMRNMSLAIDIFRDNNETIFTKNDVDLLKLYFKAYIAPFPIKHQLIISFVRLFKFPSQFLMHIIQIIRNSPNAVIIIPFLFGCIILQLKYNFCKLIYSHIKN